MKYFFPLLFFVLIACSGSSNRPYSQKMVESLSLRTFNNNRNTSTLQQADFSYVPGLVAKSVLKTFELYPDKRQYYESVKAYADRQLRDDPAAPLKISDDDIDAINAGKIFFDLYKQSVKDGDTESADKYKAAATFMYNKLKNEHTRILAPKPGAGGFIHKGRYPDQMWLDGLYMGAAFYAEWEATFGESGNTESWSDIAYQFKTIHQYTWDSEKQLNYHAWSASPTDSNSFWANQQEPFKGASKEFWGRGSGWYFAALVDVLELMPKEHVDYKALQDIYTQVALGLQRWQDKKSGCWFQLLQYDETTTADGLGDLVNGRRYNIGDLPNYLESSASAMFCYGMAKGVRLGLLDKESFMPTVEKAYQGLIDQFITLNPDQSINIIQSCASAGLGPARNPSRTGTINYYLCGSDVTITQNEGKAIGSFTMASCEYERLKN
ncbi:MAG TPA: glycoside hydrolase family 88 protein [Bacteroidales bacterium]|jgi:unsaturated rhamnogalacturonyl hydrolase|nr:glycoside hydrolase family 88 protein [Bacteroidales bacterium]HPB35444.1 glycoside hydrolase family 88 protein [Bacteroidales bacterium]HPY57337.1 glycoside hydrolase family 88 protein [Bacteroidales bacterium]HQB69709.1 glycoside hydrolase family 88 protein [Bacteroidales bacterium]HQM92280.1 glycoside hydrolase family 88 protein [Bacteroidales bacterium]